MLALLQKFNPWLRFPYLVILFDRILPYLNQKTGLGFEMTSGLVGASVLALAAMVCALLVVAICAPIMAITPISKLPIQVKKAIIVAFSIAIMTVAFWLGAMIPGFYHVYDLWAAFNTSLAFTAVLILTIPMVRR